MIHLLFPYLSTVSPQTSAHASEEAVEGRRPGTVGHEAAGGREGVAGGRTGLQWLLILLNKENLEARFIGKQIAKESCPFVKFLCHFMLPIDVPKTVKGLRRRLFVLLAVLTDLPPAQVKV